MRRRDEHPTDPRHALVDVIACVDDGVRAVWVERGYLLRLAAIPVLVKFFCFLALFAVGWERDFLRVALVMLPSYFTEGWMLAHLVRFAFYGQRWPFQPTGNQAADQAMLADRAYGITAGALFYVVIKFLLSGFLEILGSARAGMPADLSVPAAAASPASPGTVLLAIGLIFLTLWAFRMVFLYIPAAAGLRGDFLVRHRQGMRLSLRLLGIWLICFVPTVMVLLFFSSALAAPYVTEGVEIPAHISIILVIFQTLADTLVAMASTLAVAFGFKKMLFPPPRGA